MRGEPTERGESVEAVNNNNINNPTDIIPRKRPGQPTLYKSEYDDQAYKLCLLGATDAEIAEFFGVDERTVNNWKDKHEGFFQSLRAGKMVADANVADKMYQVSTGYEHPEDVIMQYQGQPVIVHTTKHYPPDAKAAFNWLKNRQPDRWKERQDININQTVTLQIGDLLPSADVHKRLAERKAEAIDVQFEEVGGAVRELPPQSE